MRCTSCGNVAEVRDVNFLVRIGMVITGLTHSKEGRLCTPCIRRTFWLCEGLTMLLGWWGIYSFFATPVILVFNVILYFSAFRMPAYPVDPPPALLHFDVEARLNPYRDEIFERVFKGETMQQVAEDIAARTGTTASDVKTFYNRD